MPTIVSLNGVVTAPDDARVSIFDRGFLHGDAVFEILRVYAGQAFAVEEHLGRLGRSAQALGFGLPIAIAQWRVEMERTIAASSEREALVRIIATRGRNDRGLDPAGVHDPLRVIVVEPLRVPPREHYVDGIKLATITVAPRIASLASHDAAKTTNYVANILALRAARAQQAHEALLVTSTGRVLEGASCNVFAWTGDRIVTPAADGTILAGITREHVLDAARELGLRVEERAMEPADVWTADEIFVTSSLREVVPVTMVDDHEVGTGSPGDVTRRLHRALRARTPGFAAPLPWE